MEWVRLKVTTVTNSGITTKLTKQRNKNENKQGTE